MSSADDTNPLIASPPASSTKQQPEESPIELEEIETAQPPKPKIKTNMVAQEVRVKVCGARTGKSAGERELFTEETTSVLIGANGGVVCLSAAVAPGQLLLLANEESKREVVVQVKRKRTYKPLSCYLELEFAEPAQRFWGREFSAATALLPKDVKELEAASLVMSAEATADEPDQPLPVPTAEEVQAFKRELETLREQTNLVHPPAANERGLALGPAPGSASVPGTESISNSQLDGVPDAAISAQSMPTEIDHVPAQWTAAEQVLLPKPALDFTMPRPKAKRSRRARGSFTPGFRAGALRLAFLITALIITAVGAAWYKHWIPWKSETEKPSASAPASPITASTAPSPESRAVTEAHSEISDGKPSTQPAASGESVAPHVVQKSAPSATLAAKRSAVPPTAKNSAESVAASDATGVIVPPKLIKSVPAVATMDAVRDFETGSVVIDAVVGTEGKVDSMNVLSGPPSLRDAAMQALKQYRYEPGTRNGQPVPAHVTVTIRFRFEP